MIHKKLKQGVIISAFAGVGKTEARKLENVIDLESSDYRFLTDPNRSDEERERTKGNPGRIDNPDWPTNYLKVIDDARERYDYICIAAFPELHDELKRMGIPVVVVVPDRSLKEEYLERYRIRGNSEQFVTARSQTWDQHLDYLEFETPFSSDRIPLGPGEYLSSLLRGGVELENNSF